MNTTTLRFLSAIALLFSLSGCWSRTGFGCESSEKGCCPEGTVEDDIGECCPVDQLDDDGVCQGDSAFADASSEILDAQALEAWAKFLAISAKASPPPARP